MNKCIGWFSDRIVLLLLWILLFPKGNIKIEEVMNCRYANDSLYTDRPNHWELALFLHEQATQEIFLLQTKLSGLLSLQSILAGLYSLTSILSTQYPRSILLTCLTITIRGILLSLQPLSISISKVVDLDRYGKSDFFDLRTQKEFHEVITDLGCRANFYADCLRGAKSLIVLSMLFYLIGIVIATLFR
jgi:hypothetical protein